MTLQYRVRILKQVQPCRETTLDRASVPRILIGEKRSHLIAPELLPQHRLALLINPMYLNNVLCQIQPNCRNLHRGRLSWLVEHHNAHFGTSMPFQVGATIPLPWVVMLLAGFLI